MSVEYSIVIPTYNSAKTLAGLLDSIQKQRFANFEVIVVDDNSSDGTLGIASRYDCKVFSLKKNRGAAYARNYGAQKASGNILIFFDSDVILYEDVLKRIHERLSKDKMPVLIGMYSGEPANKGFIPEFKALQEEVWYSRIPSNKATPFTPYVGIIRKDLFLSLGGFDVKYKDADVEDYEFTIKLMKKVPNIYLDREIKVKHHFPGIKKLVRSYFRRCFLWTEIFLKRMTFETNGTTSRQGMIHIMYVLSVLFLIASFFFRHILWIAVVFLAAGLFLDSDFIKLVFREKGVIFTFRVILLNIILSFVVVVAAIAGFIYHGFKLLIKGGEL
ncbi:MAG: glycosyltransferase family 2 protein [Candidatus Omnitrophica bacterium]|nr:glycosyltransferase family 2 protein [Candidatus Omnitrophota bacterium]